MLEQDVLSNDAKKGCGITYNSLQANRLRKHSLNLFMCTSFAFTVLMPELMVFATLRLTTTT